MLDSRDIYAFQADSTTLMSFLNNSMEKIGTYLTSSGLFSKSRRAYGNYYSRFWRANDGTRLGSAGEQGELVTLAVNHFRNILLHTLSMITQQRLVFDCMSQSTDVSARNATVIGNLVLDQLFYERQIEKQIHRAVEMGLVMGTAFLSVSWNPYAKLLGIDAEGTPIYTGEPEVTAHSMFDVVCSPFKDDDQMQQWYMVREIVNKYDLAAIFPEQEKAILALPRIPDIQLYDPLYRNDDDHVFCYKVYHKETPSMQQGRMMWYTDNDIVLLDGPNPYLHMTNSTPNGGCPIFCFRPATQYASYAGHTIAFDLMPLQETLNILDSSIITNQNNFAVQNIAVCKESSITTSDIVGGSKLIEYSLIEGAPNGGMPVPLQLCATPTEVFNYRETIVQSMETLSGINSVMRGQPQASLLSGTALALVATQANTFNSSLEANYVRFCEQVAHFLLHIISKFQKTEDLVALIGKGKSNEIRSFKGDDLAPIRKVKVTVGNPLARTMAGKLEIAEKLLSNQLIKTPQEFLEVLQTGNLVNAIDSDVAELSYIKYENEQFLKGDNQIVIATDDHVLHIKEHRAMTFRPEVRKNPQYHTALLKHITDHLDQFDVMGANNPTLLSICLGMPVVMPQPAPGTGVGGAVPQPEGGSNLQPGDISSVGQAQTASDASNQSEETLASQALNTAANQLKQSSQG